MQEYGSSTLKDSLSDETNKLAARQAMIETLTSCAARTLSPSHSPAYYVDFYTEDTHTRTRTYTFLLYSLNHSFSFTLILSLFSVNSVYLSISLSFSFFHFETHFHLSLISFFILLFHIFFTSLIPSLPFHIFTHSRYLSNEEE